MHAIRVILLLALLAVPTMVMSQTMQDCPHMTAAQHAPAASSTSSAVTDAQRAQYLNGEGMGMAKPAEMNHYPGPRHVLDVEAKLELTPTQLEGTRALFDQMHGKATALGKEILAREDTLEAMFREQRADPAAVEKLVTEIATLQGQLRVAHLSTHIRERALLTPEQVKKYDAARNYVPGEKPAPAHVHPQ